ncbi:MAG: hypothetical protein H7249_13330 [Chitinophagaceae bacterium]|nr:hypothetical protein [Oligoflexus sp.]
MSANAGLLAARLKNHYTLVFHSSALPPLPPVTFEKANILWKFSDYLIEQKNKPDAKVAVEKNAGTMPPLPGADPITAGTTTGFFSSRFHVDAGGITISTDKNIKAKLAAAGHSIDVKQITEAQKLQVAAAAALVVPKSTSFWDWWVSQGMDHIKSDTERVQDKKTQTALVAAYTKAIRAAAVDAKAHKQATTPAGSKFDFAASLKKSKAQEKIRMSTDMELKETASKITAENWVGGRILEKPIGGHSKFFQIIADAELDAPTKTAALSTSSIRIIKNGLELAGGK